MAYAPRNLRPLGVSEGAALTQRRAYDARRYALQPWRNWYKLARWLTLRRLQLAAHPLCCMCLDAGVERFACVADHVVAHRGNAALFFDPGNLQSLCKPHHDRAKQRQEAAERRALRTGAGGAKSPEPAPPGPVV